MRPGSASGSSVVVAAATVGDTTGGVKLAAVVAAVVAARMVGPFSEHEVGIVARLDGGGELTQAVLAHGPCGHSRGPFAYALDAALRLFHRGEVDALRLAR